MTNTSRFCLYSLPLSTIHTYKEMVDYAASHGIRYLETLNMLDLASPNLETARELRAYADSKGVTFPCVSVGINLVDEDNRQAVEKVKQFAHVAKILGSPILHHTIALNYSDPKLTADNMDVFYARGLEAVREIFDYAAELGIRTVFEDQGFLFNGRENFTRFLKEVNRDVGVVADFGNIQFVDEHIEEFIPLVKDRIVHVHAKDYLVTPGTAREKAPDEYTTWGGNYLQGCLVGQGGVHTEAAFQALRDAGYHGAVSLEGTILGGDEEASFCKNLETVNRYIDLYL